MTEIKTRDEYRDTTYEAVEYYNRQNYKKALSKFLEMADCNSDNFKVHEMLVYTYLKLENFSEAEKEYTICLKLAKEQNSVSRKPISFEDLVKKAGSIDSIEMSYEKLFESPSAGNFMENTDVPLKLSVLYMSRGEYEKAEAVVRKFREAYSHVLAG